MGMTSYEWSEGGCASGVSLERKGGDGRLIWVNWSFGVGYGHFGLNLVVVNG